MCFVLCLNSKKYNGCSWLFTMYRLPPSGSDWLNSQRTWIRINVSALHNGFDIDHSAFVHFSSIKNAIMLRTKVTRSSIGQPFSINVFKIIWIGVQNALDSIKLQNVLFHWQHIHTNTLATRIWNGLCVSSFVLRNHIMIIIFVKRM